MDAIAGQIRASSKSDERLVRDSLRYAAPVSAPLRASSGYYTASIETFLYDHHERVLGALAAAHPFDLDPDQKRAWEIEIGILKSALGSLRGTIYFEFDIPRLASRIDVVVVSGNAVFPIEFKCGESRYLTADYNQAWDYGLDLKNFHEGSHQAVVLPVLVATQAPTSDSSWQPPHPDGVRPPRRCFAADLTKVLKEGLLLADGPALDGDAWGSSPYHPTPSIIEAARALYSRHTVDSISRNDAGATNLRATSQAVDEIIERSRQHRERSVVFLTGVPGAGKTLVGLNIASSRREFGDTRAVFLSGNGPLVAVLQEALVRDELARARGQVRKGSVLQRVKPFIQNIHHFRDEGIRNSDPPFDHVVIFDEAQRAWDLAKTADFMKRRKKIPSFDQSESEFLVSYLDRHSDWAVIVCLVGGGQEIHTGEAGIAAWLDAVRAKFADWRVYLPAQLLGSEYAAEEAIRAFAEDPRLSRDDRLHLSVSMRSFRSEHVSAFVKAALDCDRDAARVLLQQMAAKYPIALTRDLRQAKEWIRSRARGSERYGLVASSQAQRLKPHAIDVRVSIDPVHWFLNDRQDTRSSYYLEDAATEFQIQGLELDWVCVTWDADLRLQGNHWSYHAFRGDMWTTIRDENRKRYLLNAYRVLLTRARQGMIVFVPEGDDRDPTRAHSFYDHTFAYLSDLGIENV